MRRGFACGMVGWTALAFFATVLPAADWPQLQGGPGHAGYTADQPAPPYRLLWQRDLEEPTQSAAQPVVVGDRLFVGTGHGNLHALDRETGQTLWIYRTEAPIFGSPACADGIVYVNSLDRCCHAVRARDGSLLWKFETGAPIWASPVVADGRVFVAGRDGLARALDAGSGKPLWQRPVPSLIMSTPAWDQGVLVVGVGDMRVYAFDSITGNPLWQSEKLPGSAIREYWIVAAGGNVIVTVDHAVPLRTHWREIQQQVMVPFIEAHKDDEVLVEDDVFPLLEQRFREHPDEQSIFVLNAKDGEQKFIVPLVPVEGGGGTPIPPAVDPQGRAYFMYGNIHLSASGNAFFGRLHLDTGRVEPLLKDRFAGPSHLIGFPGHQPRPGVSWPHGRGDFYGGFCVMDQSWAVSLGGQIAFPVRDPSWPFEAPFHNWHQLETGEGGYVAGDLGGQRRLGGQGVYGGGMHSTCSPVVIAGKQLYHKSPRSVLYAFCGQ